MPNSLTIGSSEIRQVDGLYSLNDLHVASGEEQRHQPRYFLAIQQTVDLISEIENSEKSLFKPLKVIQGRNGGTYACKELVIAYAAWISPAFHLKVIRVFLAQVGRTLPAPETINKAQQGELTTLIRERFPSGKDRPYAWSRFNNHFRLSSYKNLPANRFNEACEYIKTMQDDRKKNTLPPPAQTSHLSPDQVRELKSLYHQLIMLFHPYSQYAYALRGIMRILRGFQAQHELEVRPEGYVDVMGDDND